MKRRTRMQHQQTINFDTPATKEAEHITLTTSRPPPADEVQKAPPLVRPDRQLIYEDAHHWEWPDAKPLHDRDTITVDRIRDDIDGPSHRFIIKRFDQVEVYFSAKRTELVTCPQEWNQSLS